MKASPPARLDPVHRSTPALAAVGVTTIWVILATASPTRTYHFAPLVAVLVWPVLARRDGRRSHVAALRPMAGAVAVAGTGTAVLALTHSLEGPALFGGSALGETVVVIGVGLAWGLRILTRARAGWLVGAFEGEPIASG